MPSNYPLSFTCAWLIFSALWAGKSLFLRRGQRYARAKKKAASNRSFKPLSFAVFFLQVCFVPLLFWDSRGAYLSFHRSDALRIAGLLLCLAGLGLYLLSIRYLGRNYAPCFDSHLPHEIIKTGPYRFIRHPTWLAKFLVALGGMLVGGSWWLLFVVIWISVEMRRTIRMEEAELLRAFPEYENYQKRTGAVFPFLH